MPDEIRDMGDPKTGEKSPEESSSEEEQPGMELQVITPDAIISGEIRQPPLDDSSNLSFEEAMQRRKLPLQRSWDSASSGSLQPEEHSMVDTTEYSFNNCKLALRRGSSKSPEKETDVAVVGDSMTEPSARPGPSGYPGKNDQKENESPVAKMAEKCSKVVGEPTSESKPSLTSCIRSPLSEQNPSASLADGNESKSTMEVTSSESFQPDSLSDSTEYSFSNTELVLRRRSSASLSPEKTEARVDDAMTELSASPGPSGYRGKNVQKNESPVTKFAQVKEKCTKAVGKLASKVKYSLMSCTSPTRFEQKPSASLADVSEDKLDSAMEVVSPESLKDDNPLSDSTEYSFSNTKLELRRGSSISPERKTEEARVGDSAIEMSSKPEPSVSCEKTQLEKNESSVMKVVEKCTEVLVELASGTKSCTRPPPIEQNSSTSLADVSESKLDSTMEVDSSRFLEPDSSVPDSSMPDSSMPDSIESENTKLAFPRRSFMSKFPEEKTDVATVQGTMKELSGSPGSSGYSRNVRKDVSPGAKMVEKYSKVAGELVSGIKSLSSDTRPPPLSEQKSSSSSLADVSESELDSTMEVDSSRILEPDSSVSDGIESENTKLAFPRRSSTSKSPEEKTDVATVQGSTEELSASPGPSGYCTNVQKDKSPVAKMVQKCSKVAGELVSGIKSLRSGTRPPPLSEQKSSSSSLADVSENESDSSTEVARKYRKLLNKRKVCIAQPVSESQEQTRTRRKQLRRQANVEEGVEMETMAIDSAGLSENPETTTHETQTDTAKEIFYGNLCSLSDSDFSTSKETENDDDTEDTTE